MDRPTRRREGISSRPLRAGAALLTLLLAPVPAPGGDRVALATPSLAPLDRTATGAIVQPPETVVRVAPRYGDVTVDHAKHLGLRAKCVRCHGPGPVGKIVLGPRLGHERCVGCHKEARAGPTACSGCHVKSSSQTAAADLPPLVRPEPPPDPAATAAEPSAPLLIRAPMRLLRDPATMDAAGVVVVEAAAPAEEVAEASTQAQGREKFLGGREAVEVPETVVGDAPAAPEGTEADGSRLKRLIEGREVMELPEVVVATPEPAPAEPAADATTGASAGATLAMSAPSPAAAGPADSGTASPADAAPEPWVLRRQLLQFGFAAGSGVGPSLRITSRADRLETAYVLERLSSTDRARILMAYDAGASWPLRHRFTAWAVGTAGFDAQERPALGFSPVLGGRAGVEWAPPGGWLFRSVHLSVSMLYSVAPSGGIGDQSGGFRFFATLATGLPVPGLASDQSP